MKTLRYIFFIILLTAATTYVYSQSWDMFFDKGKEHYDKGNFEKAIENFELYIKYETTNPKAEAKHLLEQAKKRLAKKAETPTNAEQVAKTETVQSTEKPSPKTTEQPTQAGQPHEEYFIETALGLNMKMIYVEGGTFMMGAPEDDKEARSTEKPQHQVTLDSYYIAEFEVTQSQWEKVMGTTIYRHIDKTDGFYTFGIGNTYPMYYVSWKDANAFCKKLSTLTGRTYKLPSEAQWEFAARGGNKSRGYKYSGSNSIGEVTWYDSNSDSSTHPVGSKNYPNELGISDMSGNVSEWCSDHFSMYSSNSQINPTVPSSGDILGDYLIARGGSYAQWADNCRVYSRHLGGKSKYDDIGFRVVCIPE